MTSSTPITEQVTFFCLVRLENKWHRRAGSVDGKDIVAQNQREVTTTSEQVIEESNYL